ncbi:hypothetical protein [Nonomuraea sp. KM90]|uniref:hypothetical protein n=1 Tax=Nonomuraea sp. KM90 TaxID=3457428 RepID=UPI003FCC9B40
MVRLAFGVVTGRDQDVWDARGHLVTGESLEGGPKIDAESRTRNRAGSGAEADPVAGAPVAVGPAGADPAPALAALTRLLATGPRAAHPGAAEGGDGVTAAGAGVELCPGFVSARLDGVRGDRRDQLGLLAADEPLPGSLRGLARHGAIAPARSMELVARRIRAALGRLARASDPMLTHQVARHADTAVLCSLVVAITSWPPEPPAETTGRHLPPPSPLRFLG